MVICKLAACFQRFMAFFFIKVGFRGVKTASNCNSGWNFSLRNGAKASSGLTTASGHQSAFQGRHVCHILKGHPV